MDCEPDQLPPPYAFRADATLPAMWIRCRCDSFWCQVHRIHVRDCACPPANDWKLSPFEDHRLTEKVDVKVGDWSLHMLVPEEMAGQIKQRLFDDLVQMWVGRR